MKIFYIKSKNRDKLKEKQYIPQGKTLYRRHFPLDIVRTEINKYI